jgi:hypothetical protein
MDTWALVQWSVAAIIFENVGPVILQRVPAPGSLAHLHARGSDETTKQMPIGTTGAPDLVSDAVCNASRVAQLGGGSSAAARRQVEAATHSASQHMSDKSIQFKSSSWKITDQEVNKIILQGIADIMHQNPLARCAFFDANLHSRMPLVPTPARLKFLHASD